MELSEIKKEMLNYRDFYGGDLGNEDLIKNAKSLIDLDMILGDHYILMEDMLRDAESHLDHFRKKIGLF